MDLSEYNEVKTRGRRHKAPISQKRKKKRKQKKDKNTPEEFQKHLKSYLITIAVLTFMNLANFDGHFWVSYVIFFWGISIVSHYHAVYGKSAREKREENIMDLYEESDDFDLKHYDWEELKHQTNKDTQHGY